MEKRIDINEVEPKAYKAMYGLVGYIGSSQLTKTHIGLLEIRASQINGCAYCINMHTKDAVKNGETDQRIFVVSAWRETDLFTEEEQVILEMTEEITLVHQKDLSSQTYKKAEALFDKNYIAQLIMAIITINAWNRIAISTHLAIEQ
ncbi:AhpD family alkylhydroperoxidase [Pedobacter sp. UYP30]|uniref:carboxymuconolactone decarboxylase family protein n=1 Tax=Pedobacter sp. UYP30 TaxID=1756400 RepID=UPI00339AAE6A